VAEFRSQNKKQSGAYAYTLKHWVGGPKRLFFIFDQPPFAACVSDILLRNYYFGHYYSTMKKP